MKPVLKPPIGFNDIVEVLEQRPPNQCLTSGCPAPFPFEGAGCLGKERLKKEPGLEGNTADPDAI